MRNPQLHGSTESVIKGYRPQDILHSSRYTTRPPLKIPLVRLKHIVPPNISHSSIPSHHKFFITLTCVIRVLYIAKKSNHSWRNSHNTIPLFVRPRPINSNKPSLTTTFINMSSNMCGRTDDLDLSNTTVTVNRKEITQSNMIPSNITWKFVTVQLHTLKHPHKYTWAEICLGPHKYNRECKGKEKNKT